jgi:hypothetical protein
MSGSFDKDGALTIDDGRLITAVGKKRSGKSVLARTIFKSYPGDKMIIDVAGDDGPDGPEVITLGGTLSDLPKDWPERKRQYGENEEWRPMTLRYVPDPGSMTFLADMDHAVGIFLRHSLREYQAKRMGACLLVHEIGVVAPVNRTQAWMRRLLAHNRHNRATAIFCGPRPITIDPLVIHQADLIYIFELMNPADRRRVAESIGWDPTSLDDAVHDLGPHEYLRYDANEPQPVKGDVERRLLHFPALPEAVVRSSRTI